MKGIKSIGPAMILTAIMLLMVVIPYFLALLLTPGGMVFSGFLVNPLDGFSYLAKMNQGLTGDWLFELPYTADPGQPTLLFIFYIFLGKLSGWLSAPPIAVFHGARLFMAAAMAWAAHRFFRVASGSSGIAAWSLAVFLFTSGFGWLAAAFGWLTSDLLIPESIPMFAASLNPHFPLTYAAMALLAANALLAGSRLRQSAVNLLLGALLGAVQPFAAVSLLAVLLVWAVWELVRSPAGIKGWRNHLQLVPLAAFAVGALPWLVYDFWLTRTHEVLQAWNLQNQTPSPAVTAYLLGFGIPLVLALIGLFKWPDEGQSARRLLITWLVISALLLYAPFNLQRRFSLGMFLPMAAGAGIGLRWLTDNFRVRRWLPHLLILMAVPSNLFALAAGLGLVAEGSPLLMQMEDERAGYQWVGENLEEKPLILAAPRSGNRLPAYANVRVLYGHPFETPAAETKRALVIDLLDELAENPDDVIDDLKELEVEYVVIGPHERALLAGEQVDLSWQVEFSQGDFTLYARPDVGQ